MALSWDLSTPNAGLNPQALYSGSNSGSGNSMIMVGKLGIASIQYETPVGGNVASFVIGRIPGMNLFFTMSLTNVSIGNNNQTAVTASGLYVLNPPGGIGNIEFRPIVTAVSGSVAIVGAFTQG